MYTYDDYMKDLFLAKNSTSSRIRTDADIRILHYETGNIHLIYEQFPQYRDEEVSVSSPYDNYCVVTNIVLLQKKVIFLL